MSWADDEGISGYDVLGELEERDRRRTRVRHTITPQQELKWRTKEGVYYYPWEMTDSHLKNCLLHIEGFYGEQAPYTKWHQVFRCELKRREVQNAHQPPTNPSPKNAAVRGEAVWESLRQGWDESLRRLETMLLRSKHLKVPVTRTRRQTKKGRKTR